jgi:4-hydroxybenzoate polyprenyltransferase
VKNFGNYLSLIKFSHTIFAMPFALIGYFLAIKKYHYQLDVYLFVKVILCMIFARSAAMAFNRYLDREIDADNKRTVLREIPSGIIQAKNALTFVIISSVLFVFTCFFINTICFYLSPVALLVVLGYSYTKRFTALCHVILGVGLGLAPIGAFLAATGFFSWLPLLFSFAVVCWVSGFDIIYALQDDDFDKSKKLKSIPVFMGRKNALGFSSLLHIISTVFIVMAGYYMLAGLLYWVGALVFALLLVYQHSLVKPNDLSKVNVAFFTTNGIASVVFAALVLSDMYFF